MKRAAQEEGPAWQRARNEKTTNERIVGKADESRSEDPMAATEKDLFAEARRADLFVWMREVRTGNEYVLVPRSTRCALRQMSTFRFLADAIEACRVARKRKVHAGWVQ